MSHLKQFQHLEIPLGDIKSATNDFRDEKCIGQGGFGKVYKGELLLKEHGLTVVAIKRLQSSFGQGVPEFWREIMLLSCYKHENLVSLLGFCNEGGENILVYEYLSKRSLDLYIRSTDLSWDQRLRICVGAAYGLQYLHDPQGSQQRVLHRDIKSGNILLDENWKPKIADFGLSKYGPANKPFTFLYTDAVGTMGYCDPLYALTGYLTKESDVYSFGAVLFEVLCGRHCVQQNYEDIRRFLPVLARKCYEEKTLDTIISNSVKDQISPQCLKKFSEIAYKCVQKERENRPLMGEVVKSLETALQYQLKDMAERLPPGSYDLDSIKIPNGLESSSILLNSDTNGDDQPKSNQVNSSYLTSPIDASSASVNEALSPTGTFSGFSETKEPIRMSNGSDAYSDVSSLNGAGVDVGNKYMSDRVASQEAQNNGFKPRSPTSNSSNTYNAPDQVEAEWIEQYEPGVYITLVALRDGTRDLKRVRFSRRRFREHQAETWWSENREKVYERYNVRGSDKSSISSQTARRSAESLTPPAQY